MQQNKGNTIQQRTRRNLGQYWFHRTRDVSATWFLLSRSVVWSSRGVCGPRDCRSPGFSPSYRQQHPLAAQETAQTILQQPKNKGKELFYKSGETAFEELIAVSPYLMKWLS